MGAPRIAQLIAGIAIVAVAGALVRSPIAVAEALGKPSDSPTRLINLRASWGGTLAGIGAFVAWVPGFSPWWRAAVGFLMWTMAGIGIARLIGFVVDGSPDARQYVWIFAEIAIVIGCAIVLRR